MYIYKITSPANKHYIGQTQRSTDLRLQEHISAWKRWSKDKNNYGCVKLFYAFDQHPPETWQFEVLKECSSFEELNKTEEYFIQFYDSVQNGYNITYGGDGRKVDCLDDSHKENLSIARKEYFETDEGKEWKKVLSEKFSGENNPMYGKKVVHTEESKQKISKNMIGKNKGKIPWNKGKIGPGSKWYLVLDIDNNETIVNNINWFMKNNPEKTITVMTKTLLQSTGQYSIAKDYRAILLENYSEDLSDNEKQNIIDLAKLKLKPIRIWELTDPDGNIHIVRSLNEFSKIHNLSPSNLCMVSKGRLKSHKGWKARILN